MARILIFLFFMAQAWSIGSAQLKVYIIGDSTVETNGEENYPRMGWGQVLPLFFDTAQVKFVNTAIGGGSTRNFYTEERWGRTREMLEEGSYLFVQFGINDYLEGSRVPPEDFKEYIRTYVREAREKGAYPILCTTVRRNEMKENGMPVECYGEYAEYMREVAKETGARLIDLDSVCYRQMVDEGAEYVKWHRSNSYKKGEYGEYAEGHRDLVHFQETGVQEIARGIVEYVEGSDDEKIVELARWVLPRKRVYFQINTGNVAKTISKTNTFPKGMKVMLKSLPKEGKKFLYWMDKEGRRYSNKNLDFFVMGEEEEVFTAVYETEGKWWRYDEVEVSLPKENRIVLIRNRWNEVKIKYSGCSGLEVVGELPRGLYGRNELLRRRFTIVGSVEERDSFDVRLRAVCSGCEEEYVLRVVVKEMEDLENREGESVSVYVMGRTMYVKNGEDRAREVLVANARGEVIWVLRMERGEVKEVDVSEYMAKGHTMLIVGGKKVRM